MGQNTAILILGKKKGISDFLVIGYPYSENTCNFIYVTSLFEFDLLSF